MSRDVEATVDHDRRTATITTTFDHPPEAVWRLWSDPAAVARWWGPPGLPMTVDHHDLRPGGTVEVTVDAPGGTIRGRWDVIAVEPPRALRFTFSSDGLEPTEVDVRIVPEVDGSTQMVVTAGFTSEATFAHALAIGFVEGLSRSVAAAHDAL
ncbi:SRPBCC family protein [Actinomarinicola tropica]|uniref:SRPBCC domain-containing protein n=1 Tax=Actinomarinicola tropica TaxID=2789776 RepID=A0A5Q2RI34_9ACTN|nr:SRPBCC domain-containing protein [Actinomarinicola tropica]QGG94221.1 SRPBCC domain-containing protein [Actinomarinicola tropica]